MKNRVNLFNDRFIIFICYTKKKNLYNCLFWIYVEYHILYLWAKLIFKHNGLFVFREIVTIIIASSKIYKKNIIYVY